MQDKNVKSNLWKIFGFILSNRRNYMPILSLYFLTLPNSTAQQIGLYTGIGTIAGLLLEIPSGYLSDKIGHKQALMISKASMLLSTILFISGTKLINFILGSMFITIAFSFSSGTTQAIFHNTLVSMKKEEDFSKSYGKMAANASIVSAFMILLLPILTKISMILPIKAYLIVDIIGLFITLSIVNPKIIYSAEDVEGENVLAQIKRFYKTGFYPFSIFFGLIAGFLYSLSAYNVPFATKLGLPIVLAGSIMGLARFLWFFIGHNLAKIKKIGMKKLMFYEMIGLPSLVIIAAIVNKFYVFVILAAIWGSYFQSRSPLINEYSLNNFLKNKRYKATMISIQHQIQEVIQGILSIVIGFAMGISFKEGYLIVGGSLLILLIISYNVSKKWIK